MKDVRISSPRRWARFLLAAAVLTTTACGQSAPATGGTHHDATSAPDADTVLGERWKSVFSDPAKARQAANDFGYRVGGYAPAADGKPAYAMNGQEQVLPDASLRTHVTTGFSASGPGPTKLSRIEFRFDVVRPDAKPNTKRERDALQIPRRAVQGFLARFEVGPSDVIKRALQDFTSGMDTSFGTRTAVVAHKVDPSRTNLIVTITPA